MAVKKQHKRARLFVKEQYLDGGPRAILGVKSQYPKSRPVPCESPEGRAILAVRGQKGGGYNHHHHQQSLNREGLWGTTDDFATSFLHFSQFSTALWDLPNSRPVHSLMLSSHLGGAILAAKGNYPWGWGGAVLAVRVQYP